MSASRYRKFAIACLVSSLLLAPVAEAITVILKNKAKPRLSIRVGEKNSKISEVAFAVPATRIGDGTPVTGAPSIFIELRIQASGASPLTGELTADSLSNPLSNADGSTIPFSEISWTSRDDDIPSGRFNGTTNQSLVSFPSSGRISDYHTFSYANTAEVEAGIYSGRIIYTWAIP
jgi:hypothetical protein